VTDRQQSTRFLKILFKVPVLAGQRSFCGLVDGCSYAQFVQIRDIVEADLPAVLVINDDNQPAVGDLDAARLAELFTMSSMPLVAVDDDGTVAGFCLVLPPGTSYGSTNYAWFGERYTNFVYLDRVAVAATHRSQGIGAALYREVERRADADWFLLEVNTRPRNEGSLRFHAREGFVEVAERETPYGYAVSMMAKPLR
jgi:uncharacterized protein